jgi:hypothetical protein
LFGRDGIDQPLIGGPKTDKLGGFPKPDQYAREPKKSGDPAAERLAFGTEY